MSREIMEKFTHKRFIAVTFCLFIFICGILTVAFNFKEVFGGLYRGFVKTPTDSSISYKLTNSLKTFNDRVNEYFILHDFSLNTYGSIQKGMDKHLIDDVDPNYNVVKLKNDYLAFKANYDEYGSDLKDYLLNLNKTCDDNNIDMLYVKKLDKSTYDWEMLPNHFPYKYLSDYSKTEAELQNAGIDVLDLGKKVVEEEIDKYSLFYKTDHHWTIKGGIWASNIIADELSRVFDIRIDKNKLDLDNYTVETHEKSFLGSQGVRTGAGYTELDDFDFIYPNYSTNIDYSVRNKGIHLSGSFLDTILYKKDYREGYHAYMPATYDLTTIQNNESNNGKYAVFVVDSFGSAVAPFLSQSFERMDCIDLRYFSDDLTDYLENNKPDILIYMVNSTDAVLHDFVN